MRELACGEIVCIQNVSSRPDLNGKHALVLDIKNEHSDPRVVLSPLPLKLNCNKQISLRCACVVVLDEGPLLACLSHEGAHKDADEGYIRLGRSQ